MFAKLTGLAHVESGNRFIQTITWTNLEWVETTREASKFSPQKADQLVSELDAKEPGPKYTIERDETGESNLPPYGLDNFVVRKHV